MGLTVQQEMVMKNLSDNLCHASALTEKMQSRASTVFAASAGLMSLSSAGEMISAGPPIQSAFIGASFFGVMFVAFVAARIYAPSEKYIPGQSSNAEEVRDVYIDVSEDQAVNQIVSDRVSCFVDAKNQNARMGRLLKMMLLGFLGQTVCVCIAIGSRSCS